MTDVHSSTSADARPQSPNIGRRRFLRHLAAVPALAAAALPAAGAPSAPSNLQSLIETHRTAWQAMDSASAAYSAAEAAAEDVLIHSAHGAYSLRMSRKTVLARITDDYRYCLDSLRAGVGQIIPDHDLHVLEATIDRRRAENLAEAARVFDADDASPTAVAERAWQDAERAESAAFGAVLSFPCRTIEEVAEKAAYLLTTELVQEGGLEEDEVRTLLQSAAAALPGTIGVDLTGGARG